MPNMNAKYYATEYFYYGFIYYSDEVCFGLPENTHEVQ